MKKMILMVAALGAAWLVLAPSNVVTGPGIKVEQTPTQQALPNASAFMVGAYALTPVSEFDIKAKVLAKNSTEPVANPIYYPST